MFRISQYLQELNPPAGMGYIIRTAGLNRTKAELARDLSYLLNLWKAILERDEIQWGVWRKPYIVYPYWYLV